MAKPKKNAVVDKATNTPISTEQVSPEAELDGIVDESADSALSAQNGAPESEILTNDVGVVSSEKEEPRLNSDEIEVLEDVERELAGSQENVGEEGERPKLERLESINFGNFTPDQLARFRDAYGATVDFDALMKRDTRATCTLRVFNGQYVVAQSDARMATVGNPVGLGDSTKQLIADIYVKERVQDGKMMVKKYTITAHEFSSLQRAKFFISGSSVYKKVNIDEGRDPVHNKDLKMDITPVANKTFMKYDLEHCKTGEKIVVDAKYINS